MEHLEIAQDFIDKSRHAANLHDLAHLFFNTIKKFGCTHFICMSHVDALNPPEDAVVLTNYPLEWGMYHSAQEYHKIDPVLDTCKNTIIPFTWSNETWRAMLSLKKMHILSEAAEFELGEGHTIPIHSAEGYPASCSVVFKPGEVAPKSLMAIQVMSVYLYETALRMRKSPLPETKSLTERQKQCLEYIAQGKSDWSISKILGISESTVHYHVKSILRHYGVATRTQAIVRSLLVGDVTFGDISITAKSENKSFSGFIHIQ